MRFLGGLFMLVSGIIAVAAFTSSAAAYSEAGVTALVLGVLVAPLILIVGVILWKVGASIEADDPDSDYSKKQKEIRPLL